MTRIEGDGNPPEIEETPVPIKSIHAAAAEVALRDAAREAEKSQTLSDTTLMDYCKLYSIPFVVGSEDLGSQLLSRNNQVLFEAARGGYIEVVEALLQTPKRIQTAKKTEELSKKTLFHEKQEEEKGVQNAIEDFRSNTEYLLENINECSISIINILFNVVSENKDVGDLLFKEMPEEKRIKILKSILNGIYKSYAGEDYKMETIHNFLNNFDLSKISQIEIAKNMASTIDSWDLIKLVDKIYIHPETVDEIKEWAKSLQPYAGILIDHISLSDKNWDQRIEIAKSIVMNGGTEEVIQARDQFIDEINRKDFLDMLLKNGDLQVILKYFEIFDAHSWDSSQWSELLDRAKNHVAGAEFAKEIPEDIKTNPAIENLIQECENAFKDLEKKSGLTWIAIERKPVELENGKKGFLIVYESHPETDLFSKHRAIFGEYMAKDLYPAIEIPAPLLCDEYYQVFNSYPYMNLGLSLKKMCSAVGKLTEKRTKMTLPNVAVLSQRLKELNIDMTVESAPGILAPLVFLNMLMKGIIPYSEDAEMLHDFLAHILPTLCFILNTPNEYFEYRNRWTSTLKQGFQILEENKRELTKRGKKNVIFCLSYAADLFSSGGNIDEAFNILKKLNLKNLPEILSYYDKDPFIEIMLNRELGKKRLSTKFFKKVWDKLYRNV